MKKTILLGIAVLAVFAAVVGAGCIGADPIVGEWKAGNMPVTFNDDGTGSFEISILGFTKEYGLTWESIEGYDNTRISENIYKNRQYYQGYRYAEGYGRW